MTRSYSFLGAVACNVIAIAVNVGAIAGDIAAGLWPAAGLQAMALCFCAVLIFLLFAVDQRRQAWLTTADIDRQIRQKLLDKLERGEAVIDDSEVRH